jgi:hypothetical protein
VALGAKGRWGALRKQYIYLPLSSKYRSREIAGSSKVVLYDEHGHGGVLRNHNRAGDTGFGEYYVVAFGTRVLKTVGFENFDQLLIRDWAKS